MRPECKCGSLMDEFYDPERSGWFWGCTNCDGCSQTLHRPKTLNGPNVPWEKRSWAVGRIPGVEYENNLCPDTP